MRESNQCKNLNFGWTIPFINYKFNSFFPFPLVLQLQETICELLDFYKSFNKRQTQKQSCFCMSLLGTPCKHSQGRVGKKVFPLYKIIQFSNIFGMSGVNHSLEVLPKHISQVEVRTGPNQMGYFIVDLVLGLGSLSCWIAHHLSSSWTYILLQNDLINLGSDFSVNECKLPRPWGCKAPWCPSIPIFLKNHLLLSNTFGFISLQDISPVALAKTSRCSFAKIFSHTPSGPSKCWDFSLANTLLLAPLAVRF